MADSDRALVAAIVGVVVQALKPLRLDAAYYGVLAIVLGVTFGGLFGYAREGNAGLVPGMTDGVQAGLMAAGAYGAVAAAAKYEQPKRDARGRFVKQED